MVGPLYRIELPSNENWKLYKFPRGGGTAVLAVNEDLRTFEGRQFFPFHVTISIEMLELNSVGLPSEKEAAVLESIGRDLDTQILAEKNDFGDPTVLPLARSSWSAIREHVYRSHAPQRLDALLQALTKTGKWERVWSYEIKDDPDWTEAERYLSPSATR